MTWEPAVVRTLHCWVGKCLRIAYRILDASEGLAECSVLLQLLQTVCLIEESPTEEVVATAILTTELLWTLNVCNLLKQLVLRVEVGEFQLWKLGTGAHLVDPVNSLLCRTAYLVLTLCSAKQHVRVTHQSEVDTAVETSHHLVNNVCTEVGPLCYWKTTVDVVCHHFLVGRHWLSVSHIAVLKTFPVNLVCTDGPVETWIELTRLCALCLEQVVEPR